MWRKREACTDNKQLTEGHPTSYSLMLADVCSGWRPGHKSCQGTVVARWPYSRFLLFMPCHHLIPIWSYQHHRTVQVLYIYPRVHSELLIYHIQCTTGWYRWDGTREQMGWNQGTDGMEPGNRWDGTRVQMGWNQGTDGMEPGYRWDGTREQMGWNQGTDGMEPGNRWDGTRDVGVQSNALTTWPQVTYNRITSGLVSTSRRCWEDHTPGSLCHWSAIVGSALYR